MDPALAGLSGAVLGAVLTGGTNFLIESKRSRRDVIERQRDRDHELRLRSYDLKQAQLERLQAARAVAYPEFRRKLRSYLEVGPGLREVLRWRFEQMEPLPIDATLRKEIRVVQGDGESEWNASANSLDDALIDLQLVASDRVSRVAVRLRDLAESARVPLRIAEAVADSQDDLEELIYQFVETIEEIREIEAALREEVQNEQLLPGGSSNE